MTTNIYTKWATIPGGDMRGSGRPSVMSQMNSTCYHRMNDEYDPTIIHRLCHGGLKGEKEGLMGYSQP